MLHQILETKREEIQHIHIEELKHRDVGFRSLRQALLSSEQQPALIAEVKKASPSKGLISEHFVPTEIGQAYERGGAAAISVLTDETYFKGAKAHLEAVRAHVSLPVLRKDFIISEAQVFESASIGADAILLIGEAMSPEALYTLYQTAEAIGLECLVEVHSKETLSQLLDVFTPALLGINNRDLHTFETRLQHTNEIAKLLPEGTLFISESGIHGSDDVKTVKEYGAAGILVGEHLMRSGAPEQAIRALYGNQAT
ncbi:indole-3-glycerol phosphate synthase TrpC [Bacillaceae bacterium SIJ1]|uniref:indole-3-glycerol phosphate synthase TrpC n=1 Tax=Litoribacterium kuwaitense TaxID=1398745 RepID=UPI0013EBEC5A|nr:indole-3-glycerol phosphate synthase TrpC [Litoribacterium kuwaitense]NGP43712.1 indole-3-glycerol phosphate synthase TrpC [Litoribacterium kuwaitense]